MTPPVLQLDPAVTYRRAPGPVDTARRAELVEVLAALLLDLRRRREPDAAQGDDNDPGTEAPANRNEKTRRLGVGAAGHKG